MQLIALQYAPAWEDKARTHAHVEAMLESTRPEPGDLVVLPEMGDTGWSFNFDAVIPGDTPAWAADTARRFQIHLQVGYAEMGRDEKALNCTVIARPDGTLGPVYRKIHPFSFGNETEHFQGGDAVVVDPLPEAVVCPTICYDLRFPEIYRLGAIAGAEVMTVIASWPRARAAHWKALAIARAIENQAYVVAVNRTGRDPTFTYGGGSLVISPLGDVLDEGDSEECAVIGTFDRAALDEWRSRFPALSDLHRGLLGQPSLES